MTDVAETETINSRRELLMQALDAGAAEQIGKLLSGLYAGEIADLLESFPHGPREVLWELVHPDDRGETLVEVNDEVRAGLIEAMEP